MTPFNFTAIAGNLPTSPALMGNTVVWKPASTAAYSAHYVIEAATRRRGCRRASSTSSTASGARGRRSGAREPRPRRRPLHRLDRRLQRHVEDDRREHRRRHYRNYPRIVGETGGKDFIVAHPSADVDAARDRDRARLVRVPGTEVLGGVARVRPVEPLARAARASSSQEVSSLRVGDVGDFSNFMGAVIDGSSFKTQREAIEEAKASTAARPCSSAAATTTRTAGSSSRP